MGGDMRYSCVVLAVVLLIAGVTPALGADADPRLTFSSSVDYSVGDYGTSRDTRIVYVPFTLGVRPVDRLWISITVPWIYQSSENVVLTGGGVAVRKEDGGKFARPERSSSQSGLGDLLLRVSYTVLKERNFVPEITPYLQIKFPTAQRDKGLGTGEFDETTGVDVRQRIFDGFFGLGSLAYTFIGDPPGTNFRNSFGWSVGPGYTIGPLSLFALLEGSTAISSDQKDPLDVRVGAEYRLLPALKFTGSVTRGLSDGSADWGGSAGFAFRF
jgi:outer membrane putative beta-barrel porin/alpha-amylase